MFRPGGLGAVTTTSGRRRETWTRLIAPLSLWLCASISLQYGYYGNHRIVLGPTSSRLVQARSVFIKRVEVRDQAKKGVLIYGFSHKPQLSAQTNWSVSKYLVLRSYTQQGFSLWMNEGSRIHMRWEAQTSTLNHLQVVVIKGERTFETLSPDSVSSPYSISPYNSTQGAEAEYMISEDDKYYVSVINTNPSSIIMTVNINVTSKMYDTSNATTLCSTSDGSCKLNLSFPNDRFIILTTPNNGDLGGWYVEIAFVARVATYVAILGVIVVIIFLILKYLGACNSEDDTEEYTRTQGTTIMAPETSTRQRNETDPLLPEKPKRLEYGTGEEDLESGSSGYSSDELYDGKICVICYDGPRCCFFVPCGHCATCLDCAQRIMEEESKVCPICRRFIKKVRKLYTP